MTAAARAAAAARDAGQRSLLRVGTIASAAVTVTGLAVITLLVVTGFIAAPHAGFGLPVVLRSSSVVWLASQHVGVTVRGAGRIGMLPLGLLLLPGALLWHAGRWVVRAGGVRRLRHVGYAALALATPYAALSGALAVASRSALASSSVLQAVACGFLLALTAGALGGARALAPWAQLITLLPDRSRSVVVGVAGALAALAAAGALIAGVSLAVHLHVAVTLEDSLAPGVVGMLLLLLLQLGYLPNAIIWAIAFALGPGFAFGSATVVAPTGSALTQLPAFPMLAALPPGLHAAMPGWLEPSVLAVPYLAGGIGGLLLVRVSAAAARGATAGTPAVAARGTTPGTPGVTGKAALSLDAAPLRGLACGGVCGCVLGVLAAVSGGPLGDGRLAAVGPSAWQVGLVSAFELGVSAAVTAGVVNYLALRRAGALAEAGRPEPARPGDSVTVGADGGHVIYLDPWAGDPPAGPTPRGPSALP